MQFDRAVLVTGAGVDDRRAERHRSAGAGLGRRPQRQPDRMYAEIEECAAAPVGVDAVVGAPRGRRLGGPGRQMGECADACHAYEQAVDGWRRSEVLRVEDRTAHAFLGLDQTVGVGERARQRSLDHDVVAGLEQCDRRIDVRRRGSGHDRDVADLRNEHLVERHRLRLGQLCEVGRPGPGTRGDRRHAPVERLAGGGVHPGDHAGAPQHDFGSTLHRR